MPVRSLTSSVLRWPDAGAVEQALRAWSSDLIRRRGGVLGVACIGSYARGDWGVGSDLDLVVVLEQSPEPFWMRGSELDLAGLPVPAEAIVYTAQEWRALADRGGRFHRDLERDAVWLYRSPTWEG